MNVSLHPELVKFVEEQVAAGAYSSASDMINGALLFLKDHQDLMPKDAAEIEKLRRKIAMGIEQADRGEFVDFDAEKIKAEGRRRLAAKRIR
jgi:antitoxin ParD1/3/4